MALDGLKKGTLDVLTAREAYLGAIVYNLGTLGEMRLLLSTVRFMRARCAASQDALVHLTVGTIVYDKKCQDLLGWAKKQGPLKSTLTRLSNSGASSFLLYPPGPGIWRAYLIMEPALTIALSSAPLPCPVLVL